MIKVVNPEFIAYVAAELSRIAGEMGETEEAAALGEVLYRVQRLDADLAARLINVSSDFTVEHCKRVAVHFYRMGVASSLVTKQKPEKRRVRPRPGGTRRLQ